MSDGDKRPLSEMQPIAVELATILKPACEQIYIAGSIRRQKQLVGDIEIVCVPRVFPEGNALHFVLDTLLEEEHIEKAQLGDSQRTAWGEKYRALTFRGAKCDIFITQQDSLGLIYWLRTGPSEANEYVARRLKAYHAPMKLRDGAVWMGIDDDEVRVPVRDEDTFFRLLGIPYIPPGNRSKDTYQRYLTSPNHKWGDPIKLVEGIGALDKVATIQWDDRYAHSSGRIWVERQVTVIVQPPWDGARPYKDTHYFYELLLRTDPDAQHRAQLLQARPTFCTDFYYQQFQRWLDSEILLDDAVLLPTEALETGDTHQENVPLNLITPTAATVRAVVVAEYIASQSARNSVGHLPQLLRFKGSDICYVLDGHHRLVAARKRQLGYMPADVQDYPLTLDEALAEYETESEEDNFLADVLAEALEILNEDKVYG